MPGFLRKDTRDLRIMESLIAALPERTRHVFTLRKVYGFNQQEIAERLAIPEVEVENHLQVAALAVAYALSPLPPDLAVEVAQIVRIPTPSDS